MILSDRMRAIVAIVAEWKQDEDLFCFEQLETYVTEIETIRRIHRECQSVLRDARKM